MAKNKKEMTPEERLAAALVPEEEQPYELPKGWKWVRIGKIFIDVTDSQKKIKQKEYLLKGKWPVIDQGQHFIGGYSDADELIYTDELPVIIFGDHTRNVKYIDFQFIQGADGVKVLKPQSFIYSKFLFWLLKGLPFPSLGYRRHFPVLKKMFAPLPPLDEQQRLVARIESLFTKLDAAKAKVQAVLDSHEARKAALLHDAFAGKLTAKWRDGQSTKIFSWKTISFEDCIEKMQNGLLKRRGDAGEYVNVLRLTNIASEGLSFQDMRKILLTPDEKKKYKLAPEDVLMVRVNGSKDNVGKQLYIDKKDADNQLTFCDHLIRIHYNEQLVAPRFMVYFSHTMQYKSYVEKNMVSSAGQNTISRKGMKNLSLMLPSLPEQQRIVRILDRLLAREQRARQAAAATLAAIDSMKQSILARAFHGELGA